MISAANEFHEPKAVIDGYIAQLNLLLGGDRDLTIPDSSFWESRHVLAALSLMDVQSNDPSIVALQQKAQKALFDYGRSFIKTQRCESIRGSGGQRQPGTGWQNRDLAENAYTYITALRFIPKDQPQRQ